jgi:SlyX protein
MGNAPLVFDLVLRQIRPNCSCRKANTMYTDPQSTAQTLGARIDNLEVRVAYQDQVIEDLNKVIVEQWGKFDDLLRLIARLEERIGDTQSSAGADGHDEPPPPHY